MTSLQDALVLSLSRHLPGTEIWVAAGTYHPDAACGDRSRSFALPDGVVILGGFVGGEDHASQRNPDLNLTILSGDYLGDDEEPGGFAENAYHVVRVGAVGPETVLDGFTIMGGNADGSTFSAARGGGAWIEHGSPTFVGCRFVSNRCGAYGGAVHVDLDASPTFLDCSFASNESAGGGGAVQMYRCSATLDGCSFDANQAVAEGGAIRSHLSSVVVRNCEFTRNRSTGSRAGAISSHDSDMELASCRFTENLALGPNSGGGAIISSSPISMRDCVFERNAAPTWDGGAVWLYSGASATIEGCSFIENTAMFAGGALQSTASLDIRSCDFVNNEANTEGGAIRIAGATNETTVVRCRFEGNQSASGGAILWNGPGTISHTTFRSNTAARGGALDYYDSSTTNILDNCEITNCTATLFGGGIYCRIGAEIDIRNGTIASNVANSSGGGIQAGTGSAVSLANSIVWDNGSVQIGGFGSTMATDSIVQGGYPGANNLSADPQFENASAGNYCLLPGSPAIDSGANASILPDALDVDGDGDVTELTPVDLRGNPRRVDDPASPDTGNGGVPLVDRGAHEFLPGACPGDTNGDSQVDFADLNVLLDDWNQFAASSSADLNCDGLVNFTDLEILLENWATVCGI